MSFRTKVKSGSEVFVNVYDLTETNSYVYNIGLGFYHSGVEINGSEYSFGEGSGIACGTPKDATGAKFRESILIGETYYSNAEIDKRIDALRQQFRGEDYHIVQKNCNCFSNELCLSLLSTPIPPYINRCANFATLFSCLLPPKDIIEHTTTFSGKGNRISTATHPDDSTVKYQRQMRLKQLLK